MRTDDSDLWGQVTRLLRRRPRWHLEAMATPGASPVWCFGSAGDPDVSVAVDGGSICVHVIASEEDVELGTTDDLVEWLGTHRPGSLEEPTSGLVDRLRRKHGRFFDWD